MSFENKGSIAATVTVTREPDRSGNYICNGVADDVDINAALSYLSTLGGGSLHLGAGTYTITASVTPPSNTFIDGEGDYTILDSSGSGAVHTIYLNSVDNVDLEHFSIKGTISGTGYGILLASSNEIRIHHIHVWNNGEVAIGNTDTDCINIEISDCIIENGDHGIYIRNGHQWRIKGNGVTNMDRYGIYVECWGGTVVNNNVKYCDRGIVVNRQDTTIVGNSIGYCLDYGIIVTGDFNTITGNTVARIGYDSVNTNGGIGIYLTGSSSYYNTVVGNNINHCYDGTERDAYGIKLFNGAYNNSVIGNGIWEMPVNTGTGYGIHLDAADDNEISHNFIVGTSGQTSYGIYVSNATCNDNRIHYNTFGANLTTAFTDNGTDTVIHVLHVPFLEPIAGAAWDVTAPGGIDVDADTEGAFTMGVLPPECQQTVRIKVWAVGLAAPGVGNQMEIEFNMDAGQPDEAYNAEAISVANKDSNETNFIINDVVTWTLTPSDDSDVGDLVAGDCFEIRVMHETSVDGDANTDALFRCVEIHYV